MKRIFPLIFGTLLLWQCTNTQPSNRTSQSETYIPEQPIPEDNPQTPEKIALGRRLFYDNALSPDSSLSCSSCHIQQYAFSDTARVSVGFQHQLGVRNSSTLGNVGYNESFFREGGVFTVERAVHPPVLTEFEMNMNPAVIVERVKLNPYYVAQFNKAYGEQPTYKGVVQALAAFQRTFLTFNSPYDRYMQGDSAALTDVQKMGLALFRSEKLNCAACHIEPLFLDQKFHNIGLYETYVDYGRGRFTNDTADFGKIKTPTLRNIAVTWPYMHDGSVKTLQEVIDIYAEGGKAHPNKSKKIQPFELSEAENAALLAFMNALTDTVFLGDTALSKP